MTREQLEATATIDLESRIDVLVYQDSIPVLRDGWAKRRTEMNAINRELKRRSQEGNL